MNLNVKYSIAIVPPGGVMTSQDFFLRRIHDYFRSINCETFLIQIHPSEGITHGTFTDWIINVQDEEALINLLSKKHFHLIFHRCWMHRYTFAGKIAQQFENSIIYIKDWMDEVPREMYELVYRTSEDYDGMKMIFESGRKILSHYTKDYTNKLAEKYNVSKENFYFFPEYCNKNNFHYKNVTYSGEKKLLWAGGFVTTAEPRQICSGKIIFESFMRITHQNIHIHAALLQKIYDRIFNQSNYISWLDWVYEDTYNPFFTILPGEEINSTVFDEYHFGIAAVLQYDKESLALKSVCSAVVSKLALYLEAGLPMIVHEKWEGIAQLIHNNQIGIVLTDKDLSNMNNVLSISKDEYNQLVNNVYTFRETYTYNHMTMKPILEMLQL